MRPRDLQRALSGLASFDAPDAALEQYATPPDLAADVALAMADEERDDVSGRLILDLGCGPGVLGLACALLGAAAVVGVDVDASALALAARNAAALELDCPVDLVRADLLRGADAAEDGEDSDSDGDAPTQKY